MLCVLLFLLVTQFLLCLVLPAAAADETFFSTSLDVSGDRAWSKRFPLSSFLSQAFLVSKSFSPMMPREEKIFLCAASGANVYLFDFLFNIFFRIVMTSLSRENSSRGLC